MALKYLVLAVFCFAFVYGQDFSKKFELSQTCLGCICEAASSCNATIGCQGDICGPYRITKGYWADAGKPTIDGQLINEHQAYINCANDLICASKAVLGYMERYSQDCNADGLINCDDYARIHYLGGYGCSRIIEKTYEATYFNCRNRFPEY